MARKARDEMPHLTKTETVILEILLGSGAREMYGLEIVEDSRGRITRGSVYVLLSRMQDKGLVESRPEQAPERAGGLPRVMYKASGLGQRAHQAWGVARDAWVSGRVRGVTHG